MAEPNVTMAPAPGVPLWQYPLVALYLVLCALYVACFSWLFVIPRYTREAWAARLGLPGWIWLTNAMVLRARARIVDAENLPEKRREFLYVANHESVADIWLLMHFLQPGFLMSRSLLASPFGWGAYLSGSVGMRRVDKHSEAESIADTLHMAESSRAVVVYPEGHFGHENGRLRAPHLNFARHAYDAGIGVVPLGHAGCRRVIDRNRLPIRSGVETVLVVCPIMWPDAFDDRESFATACWEEVIDAVRRARAELAPGWPYEVGPG